MALNFGDIVVPGPSTIEYPTLLDFPAPVLQVYPRETVIAEKLEAIKKLGLLNSRMKDYYDIALDPACTCSKASISSQRFSRLSGIEERRSNPNPLGSRMPSMPIEQGRSSGGHLFVGSRFTEQSGDLERLVIEIRQFAVPVLAAVAGGWISKLDGSLALPGYKSNEVLVSLISKVFRPSRCMQGRPELGVPGRVSSSCFQKSGSA